MKLIDRNINFHEFLPKVLLQYHIGQEVKVKFLIGTYMLPKAKIQTIEEFSMQD